MSAHDEHIDADPFGLLEGLQSGLFKVLRQSTLGTGDTCLKRIEYDRDPKIPYSTGEARAVGTGYHAGLEAYYRMRRAGGPVNPFPVDIGEYVESAIAAFELEAETPGFEWIEGREVAHQKIETMVRGYFAGEHYWPKEYKVEGVEFTFLLPLWDQWITKGTVDLIVRDPNNWLIPVDHKSAKKPWKKNKESHRSTNQPAWYNHALHQLFAGENVADLFVFDIMMYSGDFERRTVEVQPQHKAGVIEKATHLCQLIDQGGPYPPNTSSFLCDARWCDHWLRCPFGEAFDRPVEITQRG